MIEKRGSSMIGSILLPMDSSSYTQAGLNLASDISSKTKAKLFGMSIVDEPAITETKAKPLGSAGFSDRAKESVLKEAFDAADALFQTFDKTAKERRIQSEFIRKTGNPTEEIIHEMVKHDLLVIGSKTYFKYATQREECDTFSHITKSTHRPMMIVPEDVSPNSFKEAVITTDGSILSNKSIQMFVLTGLANQYEKITVISSSSNIDQAQSNVKTVSEYLSHHNIKCIEKPIHAPDTTWEPVIGYFKEHNPSLLVMGVYGTGGVKEFFVGSFTSAILGKINSPIFTSR
ncbi:hypothetical protein [Leptospira sp. GIMC2001]|uniref:hypothetical protein n=1 Tax=Leptospira sp. GIMC2001 TaxID=1513297 RepID=UPI002349599A|nr:hypothetical protein [Leptospira sp. GIMC2001]WCL49491.1 hypothetical protein O4O04_19715 [Leptospira sp. GIMC2001]